MQKHWKLIVFPPLALGAAGLVYYKLKQNATNKKKKRSENEKQYPKKSIFSNAEGRYLEIMTKKDIRNDELLKKDNEIYELIESCDKKILSLEIKLKDIISKIKLKCNELVTVEKKVV